MKRHASGASSSTRSDKDFPPALGYEWQTPATPSTSDDVPSWFMPVSDPVVAMAEELVEAEWRVADLREEIINLGDTPKGRTRKDLAAQLATVFLDATRLAKAVTRLAADERDAYALLLLQTNAQSYYADPDTHKLWQRLLRKRVKLSDVLHKAGLVLWVEEGHMFVPMGLQQRLPYLAFPLVCLPTVNSVVPAADPRVLLAQIQQILTLLQSQTCEMRPRLRWRAPAYPYAQSVVCWPPVPADAQQLKANLSRERDIELVPPEPYLDPASLRLWAQTLDVSPEWAEFLYHVMIAAGIVKHGAPVMVNGELGHAWMALPPGQQLAAVYRAFRNSTPWSVWWTRWRSGEVRVRRSYHGYWGLNSIDESISMASSNLRRVLLEVLSFLPQEQWLELDAVFDLLDELFPAVASHRYLMGLIPESSEEGWLGFLHGVLVDMLIGPLHAMGFVDLSPSLKDVDAFRLHHLQAVHWGRMTEVPLEAVGRLNPTAVRLIVAKTLRSVSTRTGGELVALDDAVLEVQMPSPPAFVAFVLRWARPAGFSRNIVRYELDIGLLHQAFEDGVSPEILIESWQSTAGFEPLPEIVDWWRFWWARYGCVRVYPAQGLIETRDAFTLQEVQAALPNLQSAILGIVTPQAALLKSTDVDAVLDALSRHGYMPKESG